MIQITKAKINDIEKIQTIEKLAAKKFLEVNMPEIANYPVIPKNVLETAILNEGLWIAKFENKILGYIFCRNLKNSLHIEEVDILPDHSGKKIGKSLINYCEVLASQRGFSKTTLSTFRSVPWNMPYYQRLGYVEIEEKDFDSDLIEIREKEIKQEFDMSDRVFMMKSILKGATYLFSNTFY